jgi:hypothetical protein
MWITREKLWIKCPNWGKLAILFELLTLQYPHIWGYCKALAEIFPLDVGWGIKKFLSIRTPQVGGDRISIAFPCIFAKCESPAHIWGRSGQLTALSTYPQALLRLRLIY